jgi:hypothetical protein
MSEPKTPAVSTLSADVVANLASVLAQGITDAKNSGNKLADFCAAAHGAGLALSVSEADADVIVTALGIKLGWKDTDPRWRQNRSEAKAIVQSHGALPEGIAAYRAATGSCGYHDAVKVARSIRKHGGTVEPAIAELTAARTAKKADPIANLQRAMQKYRDVIASGKRKNKAELIAAVDTFAKAASLTLKVE